MPREPVRRAQAATLSLGMTMTLAPVHDDAEIEGAIATQAREPEGRLINLPESFSVTHRDVIIAAGPSLFALIGEAIYYPRGWRTDVLLARLSLGARTCGILHRPHPQGRQSLRPPRSPANR